MANSLFDITTFQVQLPETLDPSSTVDMNGLRFYGGQQWKQLAATYSFGSSTSPTYVLIGLVGPTFTPMLLVYGSITLNTNNNGIDFTNFVGWTLGLYTVVNQLAVGTTPAEVSGGMTIQPLDGGFYTDSLVNAGQLFTIQSFANGMVTTTAPNAFTSGQDLQFGSLVNPSGGVNNGTGYMVAAVKSPTEFTIAALDNSDVSKASAGGGTVTSVASPSDSENWGALIPNGQQMQLSTPNQLSTQSVYLGFTPARILFTQTTDAVPVPLLQFSGLQTVEYKGGNVSAGLGYQSANDAQYLQINYLGYYVFINANNDGNNEAVLTASLGCTPSVGLITTNGISQGTLTIVNQNQQIPLADGDYVHFVNLIIPPAADGSAQLLDVGPSYLVDNVLATSDTTFQLIDGYTGAIGYTDVDASAAALVKEISILRFEQQTTNGQQGTVVVTKQLHFLNPGDAIVFRDLNVTGGNFDQTLTYYVTGLYSDSTVTTGTGFFFAAQRGGVYTPPSTLTLGPGGRVTLPLGKLYGFDVGGDVTITASFNGGYQKGNFSQPTDYTIGISGSLSMSYLQEQGTSVSGTLSAKGNSDTSDGLVLQSKAGVFTIAAGAFNISGSLSVWSSATDTAKAQEKLGVSLSGISGAMISSDGGVDTWAFNGSINVTVPSWNWTGTANFGHGATNGLTLLVNPDGTRFVEEFAVSFVADQIKPPAPSSPSDQLSFSERINIMGANISVDYNRDPSQTDDWSLLIGGALTVAIGDSTPDANGNWQSTVDAITLAASTGVELSENGAKFLPGRYELDVNGPFKILGMLNVTAQSLKFIYQSAIQATNTDEQILLSGGVALPDLRNASIQFGNDGASGGLEVDITTGTWQIDGWRITVPSFSAAQLFQLKNFVLGFSKTTDANGNADYTIQAGGQVQLLSGSSAGLTVGVQVTFEVDDGKLKIDDIGASLRNMNPGLPVPPVDGFLTDVAFDVDGIPGSISADLLFGAVFGDKITVGGKEYSMVQVLVSGQYKYKDISVTGTVLLAGGTLGQITGTLDFNWGTSVYSVNLQGKFFYDAIEASAILYFSSTLDYGLFSCKLEVPPNIPIIGGTSVAEADAMYFVDHSSGGKKFLAAWFVFLGHWKYGVERDLVADKWDLIGTSTINGLAADIPSGTGPKANKYNLAYTPDSDGGDSYGLMNVVWQQPDSANDTIFIASGSNNAVQVYGPGTTPDTNGWVDDSAGGVSYMVLAPQSSPGNVLIHVAPTASFTAPDASYDDPDLYIQLPSASLNVVLTSDNVQIDPTTSWTGSFSAAAPELQDVTVTQPATTASTPGSDPVTADNATISFQWRGLDPDTTDVSLYYDYNTSGYNGTYISTISGSDLTVSVPDGDGWIAVTAAWDIGDLEPAKPLNVYAVIKDAGHAASKSDYTTSQVTPVAAAQIQVSYTGGTTVSSTELEDLLLQVTPVKLADVTSIAAGVVSVTDATDINAGDMFMFSGLSSPVGVQNTMPYYILTVSGETFTFSNVAAGAPLNEASAGQGSAYVDQDVPTIYGTNSSGVVWPHVDVNQPYRFLMPPARTVFAAAPASGQEVSNFGELVQYNTFVGNNQLLRMIYQFKVLAAIAGRVYSDLLDNGQLNSMDTGLAGATVYLDDNNNNVLDPGEDFVVTGPDGNFLFVHEWAATDAPTTTYTTWVKVIPPAGWKVTSSPSVPAAGITFTNDGIEQATLTYYNFMIASPVTLSGIVYADTDNDGVRDPGEKGLPNVAVSVVAPSGATTAATTDATGTWQATTYERGTYNVSVNLPSGGTFTTATSTLFTADAATTLLLQNGTNNSGPYAQNGLASHWNPATNSYSVWLAVLATQTVDDTPRIDFGNIGSSPSGTVGVVNTFLVDEVISRFDAFIGVWSGGGAPSLAVTYIIGEDGGGTGTELAVTPSTNEGPMLFPCSGGPLNALYALSYNPSQPDYSTVASIDNTGQVTLWTFDPSKIGGGYGGAAFSPGAQTFKLTQGTPVKMVGFNKAGSDHFQSQDLAVVYLNANGVLALAELNHATNDITTYAIGGRIFVDMIAGDFDGNGHEDIAVLTADTASQQYYLNVLLSQDDGSTDLVPYVGNDLAIAADGTPQTSLSSIRVKGDEQVLLWNTQATNGSTSYITAALVTGGQMRVSSGPASLSGRIVAISAAGVGTPATFATYSAEMSADYTVPVAIGTVQVNADGMIAISDDLTVYGGLFSGFDIGITGVTPPTSNVTSGIVYNDANSNGIHDPGETGLSGMTVRLIEPSNATQTTVTSDGSNGHPVGSYSFENVPTGAYIQVTLPPGTWTAQNPPPGVSTNANGSDGIVTGVAFSDGQVIETIGFTDGTDNEYSATIKSADLQATGQENLVVRTSSALFVQRFQPDGTSVFDRYSVSSPAAYLRPEVYLEDLTGNGRIDIVTSGQSGIDVFINIGLGEFQPFTGLLAAMFNNSPNGAYTPGRVFAGDLNSGIISAKTYTHTLNFGNNNEDIDVNGVTFQAALPTGDFYSLQAVDPRSGVTGDMAPAFGPSGGLIGNFATIAETAYQSPVSVNGTEQLTLIGLTPGMTYSTTFYTVADALGLPLGQIVVDSIGGSLTFDANIGGNRSGYMFSRTFVATSDSIVFTFFAQVASSSFYLIALTNELVTIAPYVSGNLSGDVDSSIVSGKTYTHALNFASTAPLAINGVDFTPAGSSGSNWQLVAYDSSTGAQSPMQTSCNFKNNLTGNLNIATSDFYYSESPTWEEQLTLSGLTPGVTYKTTFYSAGFYAAGQGQQMVSDSYGGNSIFDQDAGGVGNGTVLTMTFVATSDSITFTFSPSSATKNSFNQFALTNEVVVNMEYSAAATFTDDDDSGIGGDFYTHALNFNAAAPITVEDVTFTAAGQSGPNWSLHGFDSDTLATPAMLTYTGFDNDLTGEVNSLASNFFYSPVNGEQLTLTGLAVGATYVTTWYGVGFQDGIQRAQYITDSLGGSTVIDENLFGAGKGVTFSRTFTAANDSIIFTIMSVDPNTTFHQYAVTNQLVVSGTYGSGELISDAGSGITSSKTYTHALNWEGPGPMTVNDVQFEGAGRSGSNYSLVTIDPHTVVGSEIDYFLNQENNVSGELNTILSTGYVGTAKVVLSGLTPGTTYATTFYGVGDGAPGERLQTISDSEGGVYQFDENTFGNANGFYVNYTYTASSDSITFYIVADNPQNVFLQGALTNEVVPPSHQSLNVCGTEIAVIPATSGSSAKIYAAQQNTQTVFEMAWENATATLGHTGRFFLIDRLVTRLVVGSVANEGELDLVIFENSNDPNSPDLPPGSPYNQKLWLFTPDNLYATGTSLNDFGTNTYSAQIDLLLAPLFTGVQTVVFMGIAGNATDVVTYRAGSGILTTSVPNCVGFSLGAGQFVPGSRSPNILIAGGNTIAVLEPGTDSNDVDNPDSPDPTLPLVVLGTMYTPDSLNAAGVGASITTHSDDLMMVEYDETTGFAVAPHFNITGGYLVSGDAGGGLYDFPVVIPGSNGGTICGNVFNDLAGNGTWNPTYSGASGDITLYLDLNNNGQLDPAEPFAFPDRDGNYQFSQLLPRAYSVCIQVGPGYTLTTPVSVEVIITAVPGAQVTGVDFGVKAKDFES
ncbi:MULTISPECIES: SdrD B-like domain-containing protein [Acidobacteriaceae]|uniref:SdrD B-like domain-containing protein n=1 Tax=Acidobacteriaceae TaxID=204434 RepID=UPI00131D9BE8|nr:MULTISPECIES: SdrD B-like domain-containing protein [Acidobacteriaceae]MDW5265931.1 SdrD B-like domain-containing protein [Edaphobacter sp.]